MHIPNIFITHSATRFGSNRKIIREITVCDIQYDVATFT